MENLKLMCLMKLINKVGNTLSYGRVDSNLCNRS